jgi:hypothetical protein
MVWRVSRVSTLLQAHGVSEHGFKVCAEYSLTVCDVQAMACVLRG